MKPETTTTNPARLLPAVTATRTARIEAAHARHAITDHGGTWTACPAYRDRKGQTYAATVRPPIYRQTPEQLTDTAENVTRIVLRAREQASGLDLFRQLANEANSDQTAANRATLEAEAAQLKAQAATMRAEAEHLTRQATRAATAANKSQTNEEARHHRRIEREANRAAAGLRQEADKLSKAAQAKEAAAMHLVSSDRADIVQAALHAALTHDHAADPDGAFAACCAAAGRAIGMIASPSALTAHRTKVQELTPEEAAELRRRYGDGTKIPHPVKGCTSQCYDTVELRTRGKGEERRPVWCKVSHYTTVAPYVSYEAFTEATGGDTAELATNGGLNAIGTQQDAADIAAWMERANLTERERAIVAAAADQTAARHGQAAAAEYLTKRTPEIAALKTAKARREAWADAQATADRERIGAQWTSAFDRNCIYSKDNRRQIRHRIHDKLTAAQRQPDPLTEQEQEERTARRWAAMQRNSRRGRPAADRPQKLRTPYTILTATHTKTAQGQTVTTWDTAHAIPADTVTAWRTRTPGEAWREAITTAARGEAERKSRTAWAALNAAAAALVFMEATTAREAETIAATLKAEAVTTTAAAEIEAREAQRATAPRGHAPEPTAREARERARLEEADRDTAGLIAAFEAIEAARKANAKKAEGLTEQARARAAAARAELEQARARTAAYAAIMATIPPMVPTPEAKAINKARKAAAKK